MALAKISAHELKMICADFAIVGEHLAWGLDGKPVEKGGLYSLDKQRFDDSGSTYHDSIADRAAVDPAEAVMQADLWAFVGRLPHEKRAFLLAYMDFLDVDKAARECGIAPSDAAQWLAGIRGAATVFEGMTV